MMIKNMGQKVMVRMFFALAVLLFISVWNRDLIKIAYFMEQITPLGLILNGFIFCLFIFGIIKLSMAFVHYSFEEKQLDIFVEGKRKDDFDLFDEVSAKSIIYRRYLKIKEMYDRKSAINHGVLTSIMLAEESMYLSFPKFINNILILSGVFGTIISLILALTGAGTVLKTSVSGEGVGLIIHGMNTALTTTATAIVTFFFFTYFYHKLTDVQTYLFGRIEEVVLVYVVPDFAFDTESINIQTEKMIKELSGLAAGMKGNFKGMADSLAKMGGQSDSLNNMGKVFSGYQEDQNKKSGLMVNSLCEINGTLQESVSQSLVKISGQNRSQENVLRALSDKQDMQMEKSEHMLKLLGEIRDILKDGFRLG